MVALLEDATVEPTAERLERGLLDLDRVFDFSEGAEASAVAAEIAGSTSFDFSLRLDRLGLVESMSDEKTVWPN